MTRHWTVNGRFLGQPLTGVQRYAREIVCAMDALLSEGEPLTRDLDIELVVPPDTNERLSLDAIGTRFAGRLHGHAWEQCSLPGAVRGGLISLCNTGPVSVRKHVVCIHDMNTRLFPASYSRAFRLLYGSLVPALGRAAARISTVSHYSAAELVRFRVCQPDKILVAPNGHEHATRWECGSPPPLTSFPLRKTVVLIGSPVPHKNAALILGLAGRLAAAGIGVAVVGMKDARVFASGNPELASENVSWLGRLSDEAMASLLKECLCLAFPSFVEGFGLPPLEAMALGCPVIASDRASMPEICGAGALYASPDDANAWFEGIVRLASQPGLRMQMIAKGQEAAQRYRWRESAALYLKAMAVLDGIEEAVPTAALAEDEWRRQAALAG